MDPRNPLLWTEESPWVLTATSTQACSWAGADPYLSSQSPSHGLSLAGHLGS